MPIEVKDYTWKQSNEKISINVPLKGIHYVHVDILIHKNFIKLHFPPFIFEIFLRHNIDDENSKCYFTDKEALLELIKDEQGSWEKLEADIDKKEKVQIKLKIIESIQVKTREHLDNRIQLKAQLGKFAVSEAITMDTEKRKKIDVKRDMERTIAMDDFESWRQSNEISNVEENSKKSCKENSVRSQGLIIKELKDDLDKNKSDGIRSVEEKNTLPRKPELKKSKFYTKTISDIETRIIPAPRQSNTLLVSFTERIFPTPSRESSARDEEIWLKNVTAARRASGFVSEDLRPEEQDPQWCKDKGDDFFRCGNYLGAISAYSHGIKLSSKLPALYSNRAACHFAIGNFRKCIEDCSTALDFLKPPCQSNLNSRVKCITRRAAAMTRIGMLSKAIEEMKVVIRLQPNNEELKNDLFAMERAWEQNPDSD